MESPLESPISANEPHSTNIENRETRSKNESGDISLDEHLNIPEKSGDSNEASDTTAIPSTSELVAAPKVVIKPNSANGVPKSGKPMMQTLNEKSKKKVMKRNRTKQKVPVAVYQSQIKDNNVGIKLCITKSSDPPAKVKQVQKHRQKTKSKASSSEAPVKKKRRENKNKPNANLLNNAKNQNQSPFGNSLPEHVLYKIFSLVTASSGALPDLARFGRVCSLWRRVANSPSLWRTVDLSAWPREKHKTEINLKWLIENRFDDSRELLLSNWKIKNVDCVIEKLIDSCPNLEGISLAGWKELTSDQLLYLVQQFPLLCRIDLSSLNAETNIGRTAVGAASLCAALQVLESRLTHLYLANNRLANLPQVVSTLSAHCSGLELLDLSNVTTIAASHGVLHIEKLQLGCQKLKVLRITNSHITLSTASIQEQLDSPGFPVLEELSIASLADESRMMMNDDCLNRILKSSNKLKLLDVRGCVRLTHDSLIRLPTWDLKHLFLSGCNVTRDATSGLELIASKYAHSLIELDLAWANAQQPLDDALKAIAEKGDESPLSHLNLCGSSVSEEAVKCILTHCPSLSSINLSSCRGLPRGVKRPLVGDAEIAELRDTLGVVPKYASKSENLSLRNE